MTWELLAAGLVLGAAAAVWWSPSARRWRAAKRLHAAFAAASGLTAEQSAWLWRVARQRRLDEPLLVFLRPSLLAEAPGLGAAARAELRSRLFGG